VSETEKPTVEETTDEVSDNSDLQVQKLLDVLADDQFGEEEGEDDEYDARTLAARKRKVEDDQATLELMGKFVNLTDLLPPLPKKGDFDVETIKGSQYFFS
jgi:DNA-directed RNA polymerase